MMPKPKNRREVLNRLNDQIANGKIIVGAGAGKHISAHDTVDFCTHCNCH